MGTKVASLIITINFYMQRLHPQKPEPRGETNQNHYNEQGRTKVIIRAKDHQRFKVEMQFGIDVLEFFGR